MPILKKVKKVIKTYLLLAGIGFNVFVFWMVVRLPICFDRFLIKSDSTIVRSLRVSQFETFWPSKKRYDYIFMRLKGRIGYFFMALREVGAILWYKVKGYA
jgi:hypothetical protein